MRFLTVATFAAALAVAGAARAGEPSIWVKCDGLPKPESLGAQTAKLGATILTGGFYGLTIEEGGQPYEGQAGVEACTAALADPALGPFWERRVSLLRSRALHAVEAGDPEAGLKDLEATRAAGQGHVDDVAFNRSLGVSTKLFEAALLVKRGRLEEAQRLAVEAADARPYSAKIQGLSTALLAIDPAYDADEERVLSRRARLDPDGLSARALAREWGDPPGAADDWLAVVEGLRGLKPEGRLLVESMQYEDGSAVRLPIPLARTALAAARTGRVDQARALLAELDALKPWAPDVMPRNKYQAARATSTMERSKLALERASSFRPLTDAWLLAREGKYAQASAMIEQRMPAEPAAFDLVRFVNKGLGRSPTMIDKAQEDLRTTIRDRRAADLVVLAYARSLPLLEVTRRSGHKLEKPMSGLDGRDWAIKTGGRGIQVDGYHGMAVAEELALLRAAQITRTAGAPRFLVVDRRDFERYFTSAYAPRVAPDNPNPQSVETVSEIVLLPGAAPPPEYAARASLALDAEQVWAALSPVYLDSDSAGGK
ncbi:hypothetical protein BH10PSE4_BH10PSE4_47730 [soil metagenome]